MDTLKKTEQKNEITKNISLTVGEIRILQDVLYTGMRIITDAGEPKNITHYVVLKRLRGRLSKL